MKKKLFISIIYIIICLLVNVSNAAENKKSSWGENSDVFNSGFTGQEAVTDAKLKKTIQAIKDRALTNKQRKMRDMVQPTSPSIDYDNLKEFAMSEYEDPDLAQTHTVMIPMQAYSDNGESIAPGYYKLSCRKITTNEYVLDLSQGSKRVLSVSAKQTKQDLEQDSISFCNAEIIDDNRIRLMYGSIDLNLVGYLYFN